MKSPASGKGECSGYLELVFQSSAHFADHYLVTVTALCAAPALAQKSKAKTREALKPEAELFE
jgi:hypothetical protein